MLRAFTLAGLLLLSDCGPAAIGESCGEELDPDACEEGGVCVTTWGIFTDDTRCRRICTNSLDCPDRDESCRDVEGRDFSACQPCGLFGCW